MNRVDFERLRDLPDKRITAAIAFVFANDTAPVGAFENIPVWNSLGVDLIVNGHCHPGIPSVAYNFRVREVGPICRVEVNAPQHKGLRTHKHSLQLEDDPRLNLPYVVPRRDLDRKTARQIWEIICGEARISHDGIFIDP